MATHVSATVYGQIQGAPPYTDGNGNFDAGQRLISFDSVKVWSFQTGSTNFIPLPTGVQMQGGQYVYSVIAVQPTGLNVHGQQYVTDVSVATLASNAG